MSKFKKVLSYALVIAMTAGASFAGTYAYLTSEDSDVNVMTLGNVSIAQHEYQRAESEDGSYKTDKIDDKTSYVLEDFEQGKALLPVITNPGTAGSGWDETTVRMSQVDSYGGMQVFATPNAQDKFVTVENTGKTDAYVRTLVAIEIGSTDGSLIGRSDRSISSDDEAYATSTQPWICNNVGTVNIDDNHYMVIEYVYRGASDVNRHVNGILPAGDTSYPNLAQVYLKAEATNEDMVAIDGNNNGTLDILVLSQAVQTAGFADAQTALDTAFGKASEKAAEWFGGMGNVQYIEADGEKAQMAGEDAAEILAALQDGQNLIVEEDMDLIGFDANEVDAQGATVTLNGVGPEAYGYLAFLPDAGENVTVSNLNVTGSGFVEVGHYGLGGGEYTVNNLKIENFASTLANGDKGFTIGCAFMCFGNAILNDCVITGNTAVQDGVIPVSLGCGQGLTTTINRGEYDTVYCWSHSIVTIDDAEIDTIYAAPIKGTVTIKDGTHVGKLKIDYGTASEYATDENLAKITVEDGATVDNVIFNGVTYSWAEWQAK